MARELGGDLKADAGSPAGDQRHLALDHVRPERGLHSLGSNLARAGDGLAVPEASGGADGEAPNEYLTVGWMLLGDGLFGIGRRTAEAEVSRWLL